MSERPFPGLCRFRKEDWLRLGQVVSSRIRKLQSCVHMREQLRRVSLVAIVANDLPEVHGGMGRLQHVFVFFRGAGR